MGLPASHKAVIAFVSSSRDAALALLEQLQGPYDVMLVDNGGHIGHALDDAGIKVGLLETTEGTFEEALDELMSWVQAARPFVRAVYVCREGQTGLRQENMSALFATLLARQTAVESQDGFATFIVSVQAYKTLGRFAPNFDQWLERAKAYGPVIEGKHKVENDFRVLHVCTPTRGYISVPTHTFICNYQVWCARSGFGLFREHMPTAMSAVAAREECCAIVDQQMEQMPDYEHWILWCDDDMDPPINAITVMRMAIESDDRIGIISGWCSRKEEYDPGLVFAPRTSESLYPGMDFTPGDIVEVQWCGLGFALMRAEWLKAIPRPRFSSNWGGAQEDHDFTQKLRAAGCTPFVHTGLKIGHYNVNTHHTLFPYTLPNVKTNGNGEKTAKEEIHG